MFLTGTELRSDKGGNVPQTDALSTTVLVVNFVLVVLFVAVVIKRPDLSLSIQIAIYPFSPLRKSDR